MSATEPSRAAAAVIRERVTGDIAVREHVASRHRFVEQALALRSRPKTRMVPAVATLVAIAAVVLASVALIRGGRYAKALTFTAGPDGAPGVIGAYFVPVGEPFQVRFSDGTVIQLAAGARARVSATTVHGATVLVEAGTLRADVVHRAECEWIITAGPYAIRVTGTSFNLSWDPSGVLEIQMHSGSVLVHGPGAEAGVVVRGRQRFVSHTRIELVGPGGAASDDALVEAPALRLGTMGLNKFAVEPHGPLPSQSAAQPAVDAGAALEAWSALVAQGRYQEVVAHAERRGIEATLASSQANDLAALGDAARFMGRTALAERVLLALRDRYPAAPRALSAAYLLGRMADDTSRTMQAIHWYDVYLTESPAGALASEAFGRRMLALRRIGDSQRSRRAAQEYLQRFPDGAYAGVAREMVPP